MAAQALEVSTQLTAEQAEAIYAQGRDAVVFALLELAKRLAEAKEKLNPSSRPSTPSEMIPVYEKPTTGSRRRRPGAQAAGAQVGHAGSRRTRPEHIDRHVEHRADHCPECGGRLKRCAETRVRYIEEIPDIRPEVTEHTIQRDGPLYQSRCRLLETRLQTLIDTDWGDAHAARLVKRLRRHQADLLTFLSTPDVPFDNNHAERAIRPVVILRKNSDGNRSERGADLQAVSMSIFRTLKQRGHDPIRTVITSIEQFLLTGQLPPLPPKAASDN